MLYWNVYESKGQDLIFIKEVQAYSAQQALISWVESLGDNYGKVTILPVGYVTQHTAFAEPYCIRTV